jgi:hypothetical protein
MEFVKKVVKFLFSPVVVGCLAIIYPVLKEMAKKSENKVDDKIVDIVDFIKEKGIFSLVKDWILS